MKRNIVFLLVVLFAASWLCVDQAVGESVRTQQSGRSDHEFRPRSGCGELHGSRL